MRIKPPSFSITNLNWYALVFVCISLMLVQYQIEPSPADYVMAVALLVAGISYSIRKKIEPFSWNDALLALYLVYVFVQAAIQFETIDVRFALITLYLGSTYFLLKYIVVVFGEKSLSWLWWAYLVGAFITSLIMTWQLIDVYSFNGSFGNLYFGRPNGWFKDSNVAGPFLIPAILYSLHRFVINKRFVFLGLFVVFSVGLFMSFSRGAYLGYVCSVSLLTGLMVWSSWSKSKAVVWQQIRLTAIGILAIIFSWGALNIYQPFFELTFDRFGTLVKEYDTQGRAVSWEAGLKSAEKMPFGAGSGNYEKTSLEYQQGLESTKSATPSAKPMESTTSGELTKEDINDISGEKLVTEDGEEIIVTPSAHNTYIRVLLENGLIGLGLLIAAWGWLALVGGKMVWQSHSLPDWLQSNLMIAFVSFISFLPMGMFIDTLHWRFLWVIAGILAGVMYISEKFKSDESADS